MSLLRDLQDCSQSKLRPTTTRVTNSLGQMLFESKSEDGTFQISGRSPDFNVSFMEISSSPDEKIHYVIDGVYIGSQDSAINLSELNECKITHILNVATGIENAFPEKYKYLNIELLDLPQTNIREVFSRTNEFIQKAIANDGRVLIHCNAGISRSSSIVLAYLLGMHRMKYEDAYTLLKTARSVIRPNVGFVQQLKEYAAEIAQRNEKNIKDEGDEAHNMSTSDSLPIHHGTADKTRPDQLNDSQNISEESMPLPTTNDEIMLTAVVAITASTESDGEIAYAPNEENPDSIVNDITLELNDIGLELSDGDVTDIYEAGADD